MQTEKRHEHRAEGTPCVAVPHMGTRGAVEKALPFVGFSWYHKGNRRVTRTLCVFIIEVFWTKYATFTGGGGGGQIFPAVCTP